MEIYKAIILTLIWLYIAAIWSIISRITKETDKKGGKK